MATRTSGAATFSHNLITADVVPEVVRADAQQQRAILDACAGQVWLRMQRDMS